MSDLHLTVPMMAILMVFYLVLLLNWRLVRRPVFFLYGCSAIILSMLIQGILMPFVANEWAAMAMNLFNTLFGIIAFGSAVMTCYGRRLPANLPGIDEDREDSIDREEADDVEFID